MRQQVANTVLASFALAGCSMIYNPSNLPDKKLDASVADAEIPIDADPAALTLERVFPTEIFEGAGSGMGRKVVLTIHGTNIIPGATVELRQHAGETLTPKLTIDNAMVDRVAENGRMIAVPITLMVDAALAADAQIRLDVIVTQPTSMGDKVVELTELDGGAPVLVLKGLPELTSNASMDLAGGNYRYSQVTVMGDLTATGTTPLRITSTSSINITGGVLASSTGRVGGPGGASGGNGAAAGLNTGSPGGHGGPDNTGGGQPNGGGGGHAAKGGGDTGGAAYGTDSLRALYGGSGGAGGNSSLTGAGGNGGGGGGVIELTAAGNLSVGLAESNGGPGDDGANDGGGGSGGSILLRSFATLSVGNIAVAGGMGQNAGAAGRARYDAAMGPATVGTAYRGPMFNPTTPLITRDETPTITVTGKMLEEFTYFYESEEGMGIRGPFNASISSTGTNQIDLPEPLYRGSNKFCLLVKGAALGDTAPESRNCIQMVYLHRFAQ